MKQLFLNGYEADLSEDTVIALTLQINDLGSVADRQANYTNTFKLPLTTNNKEILESSEIITSSTKHPYRKLTAKYIQGGAEIIHNGIAVIESSDDNYNVTIYSGNKTFFDLIEGLKLKDIDLTVYDHLWNYSNIISSIGNTDGVIYPLVDYGNMEKVTRTAHAQKLIPWAFLKTIISAIVSDQGYTIEGVFIDSDIYANLIIPTVGLTVASRYLKAEAETTNPKLATIGGNVAEFENEISDPLEALAPPGSIVQSAGAWTRYYAYGAGKYSFRITIHYNMVGANGGFFVLDNQDGTHLTGAEGIVPGNTVDSIVLNVELIELNAGDYVEVFFAANVVGQILNILVGSRFECTFGESAILYSMVFPIAENLPDMTQKDLLKAVMQMFGIFVQIDELTKVIRFIQFKEIFSNRNIAKDWSAKRDDQQKPQIKYRIGNYSQVNWMRYKADNSIRAELGDGSFIIDDTTLPDKGDQFTLPFAASDMTVKLSGLQVPKIIRIGDDPLVQDIIETKLPRILLLDRRTLSDISVTYTDGISSFANTGDENLAYFILANKEFSLGFNINLIAKNYFELAGTLDHCKNIQQDYKLDLGDVTDFDFSIPIYDKYFGNFFYVNKISQFIEGQLTTVDLVRIKDYSSLVVNATGIIVLITIPADGDTFTVTFPSTNAIPSWSRTWIFKNVTVGPLDIQIYPGDLYTQGVNFNHQVSGTLLPGDLPAEGALQILFSDLSEGGDGVTQRFYVPGKTYYNNFNSPYSGAIGNHIVLSWSNPAIFDKTSPYLLSGGVG